MSVALFKNSFQVPSFRTLQGILVLPKQRFEIEPFLSVVFDCQSCLQVLILSLLMIVYVHGFGDYNHMFPIYSHQQIYSWADMKMVV